MSPSTAFVPVSRFAAMAMIVALAAVALDPSRGQSQILDKRRLLERQTWWDNRDWQWYEDNIPFFESPDPAVDATYFYRWELVTKHLTYGSPQTGYLFTEFIDRPFWSGRYGAISCPLGHQLYELRWLKGAAASARRDYAHYWFETPGAQPRSYSNWYGDAMWATYLVTEDREFLRGVYPFMQRQYEGWLAEHFDSSKGLFEWDGLHDGMEENINSRQTDDTGTGAEGYRPTLNSYMYADATAIARTAALLGDAPVQATYLRRAADIKRHVQEELWDPRRQFFLHQFAHDERDGIKAGTRTYDTGKYAGNPHGRELLGYVPWQFDLPDSGKGYEAAWTFLMDTAYFLAPYGPTTAEQHDPLFHVSPQCCYWSGNSWPYATTQTLVAMANLLNDYRQSVVTKRDYFALFDIYTRTQRLNGRPYIAEAANPYTGSWDGHNTFDHSEHYFHSGYVDLVVTGLAGLRPRADGELEVNPLAPDDWAYFALDDVAYHGHRVTIIWDRDGDHYHRGRGLTLLVDGRIVANRSSLGRLTVPLPRVSRSATNPRSGRDSARIRWANLAVHNDRTAYPLLTASYSAPESPVVFANDGNRWFDVSPPNRWTTVGSPNARDTLALDFGAPRPIDHLALYLLDDGPGAPVRAPSRVDVELWEGNGWTRATSETRSPARPIGRRVTDIRVGTQTVAKVRLVFTPRAGAAVGLTEIEAWSPVGGPVAPPLTTSPDLAFNDGRAPFPRASASFTSPHDRIDDVNDMLVAFSRYSRNRWTAYGSPNKEDWVEIDFGSPRQVQVLDLYLWGDDRGVRAPRAYTVQYWDGATWADARERSRQPSRPTASAVNRVRIDPVLTPKVRVMFVHDLPAFSGMTELMVWQ